MTVDLKDLANRVRQFDLLELPGQPRMAHMGTTALMHDLWTAVRTLAGEAEPGGAPDQHGTWRVVDDNGKRWRVEAAALDIVIQPVGAVLAREAERLCRRIAQALNTDRAAAEGAVHPAWEAWLAEVERIVRDQATTAAGHAIATIRALERPDADA